MRSPDASRDGQTPDGRQVCVTEGPSWRTRTFSESEDNRAPEKLESIINKAAARAYLTAQNLVGRLIEVPRRHKRVGALCSADIDFSRFRSGPSTRDLPEQSHLMRVAIDLAGCGNRSSGRCASAHGDDLLDLPSRFQRRAQHSATTTCASALSLPHPKQSRRLARSRCLSFQRSRFHHRQCAAGVVADLRRHLVR